MARRSYQRSLATRLISTVLRWYLAFAVGVTLVQLALEYTSVSRTIGADMVSLGRSFAPSVREALWLFDRPLLNTMAKGLAQTAFISGVKIENRDGAVIAQAGRVPAGPDQGGNGWSAQYQAHSMALEQSTARGDAKFLGRLTLYSDRAVVLERIRYSFLVILFNSILKTLGLWLIFYWVVTRWLAGPLERLADAVGNVNFDDRQDNTTPFDYPHSDELGVLVKALNDMRARLTASRDERELLHQKLEEQVAQRTQTLQEALDLNRTLIGQSPLGFLAYRPDGQCILANRAVCDIVGGTEAEILQQNFRTHPSWKANNFLALAERTLITGQPGKGSGQLVTSFGKTLWVEATLSTFALDGQPHLLVMVSDVTAARANAEAMREAKDSAEQASRSKSDFLANMSHELRTPINAIAGFTTLAQRTALSVQQEDYLDKIQLASRALLRIISDLLDFSKIEAGHLEMERITFRLDQVMENAFAHVSQAAERKGLKLLLHVAPGLPAQWIGDPLRLGQILTNLCGNAVKFTEHGEIELRVAPAGTRLLFSVRDTGIGVTQEQAAKLFRAFSQADISTTRRFGGTGLGLAISARLVSLMNGRIWVESEAGRGATFLFEVELGQAEPGAPAIEPAPLLAARTHGDRLPGTRLLLVEDNPINQQLARELLEQEGAHVHVAANGKVALALLEELGLDYFDAALVDLQMPEMDGYEATARIRALPGGARLPLIAMTAHAMLEEREHCLAVGMNDHLGKPIDTDLMVSKLARWIGAARMARAAARPAPPAPALRAAAALPADISGVAVADGLRRCGGNAGLYRDLLLQFHGHFGDAALRMDEHLRAGEFKPARQLAHMIKGAAANLAMDELAAAAGALEAGLNAQGSAP
ncbi:MAG: ATP-binding protein [Pseudomonadota bacterium]